MKVNEFKRKLKRNFKVFNIYKVPDGDGYRITLKPEVLEFFDKHMGINNISYPEINIGNYGGFYYVAVYVDGSTYADITSPKLRDELKTLYQALDEAYKILRAYKNRTLRFTPSVYEKTLTGKERANLMKKFRKTREILIRLM